MPPLIKAKASGSFYKQFNIHDYREVLIRFPKPSAHPFAGLFVGQVEHISEGYVPPMYNPLR